MAVLLLFVDGIGIGTPGVQNPFSGVETRYLSMLGGKGALPPDGFRAAATDAQLGVEGLPQSATGQAALFTGENAALLLGYHLWAFPNAPLRTLIAQRSIVKRMAERGATVAFLNAFAGPYADKDASVRRSATTHAALAGGARLRTFEDARDERAVTFDLTGEVLRLRGLDCPARTIEQAARVLVRAAREVDFAVFEYFLTDRAGHSRDMTWAREEVKKLDRLIAAVAEAWDPERDLFVVASDHGNIEDVGLRGHTENRVPTLALGRGADSLVEGARTLCTLAGALDRAVGPDQDDQDTMETMETMETIA